MTAFLRAFLICNGCDDVFDTSTVPSARTLAEARREAQGDGWTRKRDGRDLCPGCTETEAGR